MMFERQESICPREALPPVTIIGCGGIGSRVAEVLIAMGVPELRLWDPDFVEEVNIGPQWFRRDQIGKSKVLSLVENVSILNGDPGEGERLTHDYTPELACREEKYRAQGLSGVIVLGVDSLAERKRIYRVIRRHSRPVELLIDGRMGWDLLRVYFVPMDDEVIRRRYEASLERTPGDLPCTARAVAYNVFGIASIIGAGIKSWSLKQALPWRVSLDFKAWWSLIEDGIS